MGGEETYVDILAVVVAVCGNGWIMIMLVVRSTRGSLLPVKLLGSSLNNDMQMYARTSRVLVNRKEKRMRGPKKEEGEKREDCFPTNADDRNERKTREEG